MAIIGRHFERQRVMLCGDHYQDCTFVACELVYDGRAVHLLDNSFENCSLSFEGVAAATLDFLVVLCREHAELRAVLARKLGLLGEAAPKTSAVVSIRH